MYAIFFHAHQKLDKLAYEHFSRLVDVHSGFPSYKQIKHFEGQNGPDATKLKKSTGEEQPWHFYDPFNPEDTELLDIIANHYATLVTALKTKNRVRAAFEAAWLAHAIVDGLTPAHHYPYEEELERLRGGETRHTRTTLRSRAIVKAETPRESIKRSMQLVGPKGLLTNHTMFEGGAYTIIRTMSYTRGNAPSKEAFARLEEEGLVSYFVERAQVVAELKEYEQFMQAGWTPKLGREVRKCLIPEMIRMITLAWYQAAKDAGLDCEVVSK